MQYDVSKSDGEPKYAGGEYKKWGWVGVTDDGVCETDHDVRI